MGVYDGLIKWMKYQRGSVHIVWKSLLLSKVSTRALRLVFSTSFNLYSSISTIEFKHSLIYKQVMMKGLVRKQVINKPPTSFFSKMRRSDIKSNSKPKTSLAIYLLLFSSNALLVDIFISRLQRPSVLDNPQVFSIFFPTRLISFSQSKTTSQYSGILLGSTSDRKTSFYFLTLILPRLISVKYSLFWSSSPSEVVMVAILGYMFGFIMSNVFFMKISFWNSLTPVIYLSSESPLSLICWQLSSMSYVLLVDYGVMALGVQGGVVGFFSELQQYCIDCRYGQYGVVRGVWRVRCWAIDFNMLR